MTTITPTTSNITTYANNVAPDVIVKAAYDLPLVHFEFGGIARFLRDQYFPIVTWGGTASAPTFTYGTQLRQAHQHRRAACSGRSRGYIGKPGTYPAVEVAVQAMAGYRCTGRYGSSQLADATLRPDQTLEPIKNYHGLFSLESHRQPKFDVFAYYGGEYAQRTVYQHARRAATSATVRRTSAMRVATTSLLRRPVPLAMAARTGSLGATACGSPTKYIQEGMIGFQYRPIIARSTDACSTRQRTASSSASLWAGVGICRRPRSARGRRTA